MKAHIEIYLKAFGYDISDFMPCEICSQLAVNVHHISPRGRGGSKEKDYISNLMGVCMSCHNDCENHVYSKERQYEIHHEFMRKKGIEI